jgi:hypothetical protein
MKFKKYCISNLRSMTDPNKISEDSQPSVHLELEDGSFKMFVADKNVSEYENNIVAELQKSRQYTFEEFSSSNPAYFVEDRGVYSEGKEQEINKILSDYGYPTK